MFAQVVARRLARMKVQTSARSSEASDQTNAPMDARGLMDKYQMDAPNLVPVERSATRRMAAERPDAQVAGGTRTRFQLDAQNLAAVQVAAVFASDSDGRDQTNAQAAEDMDSDFQADAPSQARAVAVASAERCAVGDLTGAPTVASE